jgi:hypothetical protein
MYLFVVYHNRQLTPQQGQQALEQMMQGIDTQQTRVSAGAGALRLPGVNRFENPFPQWLRDAATQEWKLHYNDINYCYQQGFNARHEAESKMDWFERVARPWIRQRDPALEGNVQVRVMDEHDETLIFDSF